MRRIVTLLAPTDIGAAGTRTIPINLNEQISRIMLVWNATNVTVSVMLEEIMECISRVELVDGSDVKFSTTGKQAQGINFCDTKIMPHSYAPLAVGGVFRAVASLDFGRFLWDPQFALRPATMKNPQLKITWDEDACNTAVVVNSLSVYAFVDDAPAGGGANGYIKTREIYQYAMAANGHEYVELPVDYPIQKVLEQSLYDDHDTDTLLKHFTIDVEHGRFVPYDILAADYVDYLSEIYPEVVIPVCLDEVVTAKVLYVPTAKDNRILIAYDETPFVTAQSLFAVPTFTGQIINLAASVDIQADTGVVTGRLPQGVVPFDFGDPMVPESWLQVGGINNIRMDIEASADADAGDTTRIVVKQPVMY